MKVSMEESDYNKIVRHVESLERRNHEIGERYARAVEIMKEEIRRLSCENKGLREQVEVMRFFVELSGFDISSVNSPSEPFKCVCI